MAFTDSNIKFSVIFDDVPKLQITDNIQSAYLSTYGIALADVEIRLKIEGTGTSGVIYDNLLGITPDIGLSTSWIKQILPADGLKLNINGYIAEDVYTITYQVYDSAADETYTQIVTHNFSYTRPTPNLELSFSCGTSLVAPYIKSKDNTTYNVVWGGISHTGVVTYLSHKLNYPISSGVPQVVQAVPLQELSSGTLWTLLNTSFVSSSALFTIDTQTYVTVYYKLYIDVETSVDVQCDECTCLYWNCFNNIYDKYYYYAGKNAVEAKKYRDLLTEITINYTLYHQSLNCSGDSEKFCTKLKELAVAENCTCKINQTESTQISGVLGSGSLLAYVNGGSVDGNGDLILTYSDATTVNAGSVIGATGVAGADGADGGAGADGTNGQDGVAGTTIISASNIAETLVLTPSTWSVFTKTYTYADTLFANNGDTLKVTASFMQDSTNAQKCCISLDTYKLFSSELEIGKQVIMEVVITLVGTNSFLINAKFSTADSKNAIITITNTAPTSIGFYGWSAISSSLVLENCMIEQCTGGILI